MANEIRIKVTADDQASGKLDKIKKNFGDIAKIGAGVAAGFAITKGVDAITSTFTSSIGAARDLNETLSKSNTIFKDNARAVEDWASQAATDFGQTKEQALDAASGFGNMFDQLGIGSDISADMSMSMTELASDFASFHNMDITQVLEAQSAAFRGEYDALQRVVPTINAAAVQTKALEMTGKENASQLTLQEKALATYQLMLDGAGEAAGDFDKTSGSLANQQRILNAEWGNMKAQIGAVLLPALTDLAVFTTGTVIPALKQFKEDVGPELEAFFKAIKQWWEGDGKPALDNLKAAFEAVWPVVKPILEQFKDALVLVGTVWANSVGIIVDLISGDFSGAWAKAKEILGAFETFFGDTMENIKDFVRELGVALFDLGKEAFNKLQDGISNVWATRIWPWMQDLPGNILDALGDLASILFDAGKQIITGLWDGMKSVWGGVEDWLGGLGGKIQGLKGPIEKDRALLLQQGKAIMQGLGAGMEEGWGKYVENMLRHKTEQLAEMGAKMAGIFSPSGDPNARMAPGLGDTALPTNPGLTWADYWNNQGGFTSIDHIAMNRALAANESTRGMVGQGVQIILQGPGMAQLANDITIEQSGAFR